MVLLMLALVTIKTAELMFEPRKTSEETHFIINHYFNNLNNKFTLET